MGTILIPTVLLLFKLEGGDDLYPASLRSHLVNAVTATVLPSLKEPPQLHFSAEPPLFLGLVLERRSLLPSRPLLPPPLPLPL